MALIAGTIAINVQPIGLKKQHKFNFKSYPQKIWRFIKVTSK